MATSSSTLKPLLILPSSHSTLSSKSPKPSTTHFPSNISTLPSLKSKPSKGFASPELLDTLETLDDSTEPLDRASLEAYKVAAGSEIHGTPKISIEDDCIDKMKLTPKIRIKLKVLLCALNRGIVQADQGCSKNIKHEDYVSCISTHQEGNLLCSQISSRSQRCKIPFRNQDSPASHRYSLSN